MPVLIQSAEQVERLAVQQKLAVSRLESPKSDNSLDRIELQLQRDGSSTEARTGKPASVPAGYQDSVADYYRRLSKNP